MVEKSSGLHGTGLVGRVGNHHGCGDHTGGDEHRENAPARKDVPMEIADEAPITGFQLDIMDKSYQGGLSQNFLLPPANVVCEGYVFTGVCLSRGCLVRGVWSRGCLLKGWGCLVGRCLLLGGYLVLEGCRVQTPPGWLLLRAVHILLECILFFAILSYFEISAK